jgi:branched-chain amino acid transport system ATP-binding protein
MLALSNVTAKYGSLTALSDISLEIPEGAKVGVFGHNGAGKTTLLRCIVGAVVPVGGTINWNGEPVPRGNVPEAVKKGIGFVPQGHNVFPTLSVEQNYRLFPVLKERRGQRAGSMSGGEQQMLALGMALMTHPKWLLLDEPATGLAPVIVRNVMERLASVNERFKTGLIVVEQNVPATLKLVDTAIIIKSGAIVFQGQSKELAANPELWKWF